MTIATQTKNKSPLGNPVAIFRTGDHVSSNGTRVSITAKDLDDIVKNFDSNDKFPAVIGHPKTNAPAFGWGTGLFVENDILYVKSFDKVDAAFEQMVVDGAFRRRSASIEKTPDGSWQLNHVGWLGAKAPAIKGLPTDFEVSDEGVEFDFEESEAEESDFAMSDSQQRDLGWGFSTIASFIRGLKNRMIERDGLKAADDEIPEYQIEQLQSTGSNLLNTQDTPVNYVSYTDPETGVVTVAIDPAEERVKKKSKGEAPKNFSAADVEAEKQKAIAQGREAAKAEFAQEQKCRDLAKGWVEAGKILPAQELQMANFMASLNNEQVFNFSESGDDKDQKTSFDFMCHFFESAGDNWSHLGKELVTDDNAPDGGIQGDTVSARAGNIAAKAADFVASEAEAGRTISIAQAVDHLTQSGEENE